MKTHPSTYRTADKQEKIRPTYAYIVKHGANLYHFCNSDKTIRLINLPATHGSDPQNLISAQVNHTAIKQESEINAPQIQMNVGLNSSPFAAILKSFVLQSVPDPITVIIARINPVAIDGVDIDWLQDAYVIFKGVVVNIAFNRHTIQLNLISLLLQNEGLVPRYFYQKTCQHMLYGRGCGVTADQDAYRIVTTTTAIDSRWRSVDIAETALDGEAITVETFQAGYLWLMDGSLVVSRIRIDGTKILDGGAGTRLYLGWWHQDIEVGSSVKVFRGCPRTASACSEIFANLPNFGGMAYIPNINPTINGIRK